MTTWAGGVCRTNGISIHYLRTGGSGPAVVLLHGLTGSGACWTHLARALEPDFDVVMPDARGHGGSSAPGQGYSYQDLATDVAGLIGALELSRPVLVGHSMGGMTAALVAGRGSEAPGGPVLRGLVLVDPTFLSPARQRDVHDSDVADLHRRTLSRSASELVADARARHPHRDPELLRIQAEARLRTSLEAFDVLAPPGPDHHDVVRTVDVPTLLVIGDKDPVVTPGAAARLRQLNPRLRVAQITDAGHGLPFDQPERLNDVVTPFVHALAGNRVEPEAGGAADWRA